MEVLAAAAEDWGAFGERDLVRQVLPYAKHGYRGLLCVVINVRTGRVRVSTEGLACGPDERMGWEQLHDLKARHYVERAVELGL